MYGSSRSNIRFCGSVYEFKFYSNSPLSFADKKYSNLCQIFSKEDS
jgi:hypothetical protein